VSDTTDADKELKVDKQNISILNQRNTDSKSYRMHIRYESQLREPLVYGEKDYHQVTEDICRPIEAKPGRLWYVGFFIAVALLLFGIYSVTDEVIYGVG